MVFQADTGASTEKILEPHDLRQSALTKNNSQVLLQYNHFQYYYVIFYLFMTFVSRLYSHLPISYIVPMSLRKSQINQ